MAKPQYNTAIHKATVAHYRTLVDTGQGMCAELICLHPTRHIPPGSNVDAAHDRTNGGYLGPAHPKCNRAEGARHRHAKARRNKRWAL